MRGYLPSAIAKSKQTKQGDWFFRSLIGHSLDVLYVARALLEDGRTRAMLDRLAGFPLTPAHIDRLLVLIGLHDFGKVNTEFQDRVLGVGEGRSHLLEAIHMLDAPAFKKLLGPIGRWCDDYTGAFIAIIGHHGGPVDLSEITTQGPAIDASWQPQGHYTPMREVRALIEEVRAACPNARGRGRRLPAAHAFWHFVAGWLQAADKIASERMRLDGPDHRPDYARNVVRAFAWTGAGAASPGAAGVLGGKPLRPLQQALLAASALHQLIIAEAPTGNGKTEAALVHGTRLMDAKLVTGIYFAVPTRSAATEIFGRVSSIMTTLYPDLVGKCVRAVPGNLGVDGDDTARSWPIGNPFKVGAAPVVVGTVDQAMLSVLKARHHSLRRFALSRHLLVIDEVHASDPYMAAIIAHLVLNHMRQGGYVMLMSATLGEEIKHRFLKRRILPFVEAKAVDYPMLTQAGPTGGVTTLKLDPPADLTQKVVHTTIRGVAACYREAIRRFRSGETVLWIRSTVRDAVADYEHLRALNAPDITAGLVLHHSRYTDVDRKHLDSVVLSALNRASLDLEPRPPRIIIATQTCEQSLDIDADFMVTDACPADVMLQRFGRLGRFRPDERESWIIDPVPTTEAAWDRYVVAKGGGLGLSVGAHGQGWAFVYPSLVVRSTLEWLTSNPTVRVPDDQQGREWVEVATHSLQLRAIADGYGPLWSSAWRRLYEQGEVKRTQAIQGLVFFERAYGEAEVINAISTRLGDGSAEVPVDGLTAAFDPGTIVETMPVSFRWLRGFDPSQRITGEVTTTVGDKQFIRITDGAAATVLSYGPLGLQRQV